MNRKLYCNKVLTMVLALFAFAATITSGRAQGSWSTLPTMPTMRVGLGSATGPNGKIYAIGGVNAVGTYDNFLDTVEAYDPISNAWATVAPMPTPRSGMAVVTGPDGRIYAIGGGNSSGASGANEAYDTSLKQWVQLAAMPTIRSGLCAVVGPDHKIYAIGGLDHPLGSYLSTVEAYDPQTNTWTTAAPLPVPTCVPGAGLGGDGRIYIAGGITGIPNVSGTVLNTVEAYNVTRNSWTNVATLPLATQCPAAASLGGKICIIGGIDSGANIYNTTQVYDPQTGLWDTVAPMPTARFSCAAATGLNGRIYVFGGQDGQYPGGVLATAEVYTPPPPTVVIASPANHAVVSGVINITGLISDMAPTGVWTLTCSGVQIGAGIGTAPAVSWNTLLWAEGSHILSLKEKDVAGNTGSSTITVTVNNKGVSSIAVTRPSNGVVVRGTVIVTGAIYDATLGSWTITDNGKQIGMGTGGSPNVPWNTTKLVDGAHKLVLTEIDAAHHTASASVSVTVNNTGVASVLITSPANKAAVKGAVTVTGTITDATPGTWTLTCDGAQIGSGTGINPRVSWDTTEWAEKAHTLVLTEIDAAGNKGSTAITVTVGIP